VTAAQFWVDLEFLRRLKRINEVERAIQAYLKYQSKRAEPWMYLLLAVAFEVNGRPATDVRVALGWAGYLAKRQADAFTLVEVADILLLRDYFEIELPNALPPVKCGELLDLAHQKAPERAEPILMSMILAEKAKDPERMAQAAGQLLELGWPGVDEAWRMGTRRRTEEMAKQLETLGRTEEAKTLLQALERAWTRDLFVRLSWKGNAGLDLVVAEPLGATARFEEPRTVFGGAITKSGRGKSPESTYSIPFAFDGVYQIKVEKLYNDEEDPAREITLEVISHEGLPEEEHQTHTIKLDDKKPLLVELKGGRRTKVLPLQAPSRLTVLPSESEKSKQNPRDKGPSSPTAKAAEALRGGSPKSKSGTSTIDTGTEKGKARGIR
jgi:hypothetical protein